MRTHAVDFPQFSKQTDRSTDGWQLSCLDQYFANFDS